MNLFFGMVASVFDFFVDLGNRVDFMGLNLFDISLIFFVFACIFRWLFPIIFAGEGTSGSGSIGFSVGAAADMVKNEPRNRSFSQGAEYVGKNRKK